MRDNNKRKREEESYYMQTLTENTNYSGGPTTTTQNSQTPVIEQNPTFNQSVLLNQPIIQNQQLLYQLQRTTDSQQNLVYLIVPTNENIQVQAVPLTVVNDQQNTTQYIESTQLSSQVNDRSENTIILQDIKEESDDKAELYTENNLSTVQQKNTQYSYVSKVSAKQSANNVYNVNPSYSQVYPKTTSSNANKDSAVPNKPHWYRCDYKDCSESFYSLYEKKQHLDAHIFPENNEFKCSICNMIFDKAVDRNKHVESHAVPPTFKCKQCQRDFSYFTVLMKHLEEKKCSVKNPVYCFFCETRIVDYDELVRHNHLNMKQCSCGTKICGNQGFELHLSVCRQVKSSEKVQSPFEKKRLKTKKT